MSNPAAAWRRYKNGSGPRHQLTETIARAIHDNSYGKNCWDYDKIRDSWLAVGSWQAAEAVMEALPIKVLL